MRRISLSYTDLGQTETVTQYDNATVGSGSIVDEVLYSYDGWTNVSKFEQDLNSAVGAAGSVDDYEVSYTYEKATGGRNTLRRDSVTLPSGNLLDYLYLSSSGKHDDETSRVSGIEDGALRLVDYRYNGVGQVVTTLHQQPEIHWKLDPDGDDTFADLDRFNRVTSSRWTVDLATDVDFYSVDISYDRGSNITLVEDNVHTGFDASYTMDDVDRLTRTQEGTWNGSSIASETRDQSWTLSHTGNWDDAQWDLNGDGDFVDTDEYDDTRTHNAVNELTARDVDSDSTDDFTHSYDAVGNMTDDGESYKYEWDPFGRLRKVKNQSDALVAEYRYNGLGFQVSEHADTDDNGDVDGSDLWFHSAFDERWRKLATFRESDADPKEEFIPHQAGLSGRGRSSYINLVVCRDRDANTAWTAASDGVLEEKMFYCQNWRGDVSAIVKSTGYLYEWAKYSSYGVPFGLPGGDTDSDGDCDATDVTQIQTWINGASYDVRGDIDLDWDVDADDKSVVQSFFQGKSAGWGELSTIRIRRGYAGYHRGMHGMWHARNRQLNAFAGKWLSRDPFGYIDEANLYEYVKSNTWVFADPMGAFSLSAGYYPPLGGLPGKLAGEALRRAAQALVGLGEYAFDEYLDYLLKLVKEAQEEYKEGKALTKCYSNAGEWTALNCLSADAAGAYSGCVANEMANVDAALDSIPLPPTGNAGIVDGLLSDIREYNLLALYEEIKQQGDFGCMTTVLNDYPDDGAACSAGYHADITACNNGD